MAYKIGILSDTHGVLPVEIHDVFKDVDRIIHAGDIGGQEIIFELETIAPVSAVFGNTDGQALRRNLSAHLEFTIDGVDLIVNHYPLNFGTDARPTARIHGHTHRPLARERNGSWLVNPGSAAFPRGEFRPSVALMSIEKGRAAVDIVYL